MAIGDATISVVRGFFTFGIDIGNLEAVSLGCNLFLALLGCKPDLFALGISFSLLAVVLSCFLQRYVNEKIKSKQISSLFTKNQTAVQPSNHRKNVPVANKINTRVAESYLKR